MSRKAGMTLRMRLLLSFSLILLIPAITIGTVAYKSAHSKVEEKMTESAQGSVSILDQLITNYLDPIQKEVEFLARTMPPSDQSGNAVREYLSEFARLHNEISNTYIGEATGKIMLVPDQKLPDGYDPRTRPWYKEAMAHAGLSIITAPYVDAGSGTITVTIASTTRDGSRVIAVDLNLNMLAKQMSAASIGRTGYVSVSDVQDKVLADPKRKVGSDIPASVVKNVAGSIEGVFNYKDAANGGTEKWVYTTNGKTGWRLFGIVPFAEVEQDTFPIFLNTMIVIIIAIVAGAGIVYLIIRSVMNPIRKLMDAADQISNGDLTVTVDNGGRKDEISRLSDSFNRMVGSLKAVLIEVNQTSGMLAASSEQLTASSEQTSQATQYIAENIQEVAEGADRQVESIEAGSASVHSMSQGVENIAHSAHLIAASAVQASGKSQEGGSVIRDAINQMQSIHHTVGDLGNVIRDLQNYSEEIGGIVTLIGEISSQTNLLSLNASIEAARAGEHGRGFAVVAQEVKKLSEETGVSSRKIAELIRQVQLGAERAVVSMQQTTDEVSSGIRVMDHADTLFRNIQASVTEVEAQIQDMSNTAQHISEGGQVTVRSIESISVIVAGNASATQNVSAAAQQQLASMEEIAASSAALSNMALELQELVERFKV
ncbi:hypothetical protein SY83_09140 [Paenibacillus swuensis]|uniref:Chemotaxis protein n=2 Tax=Paenibacillus swuensis TaxID=1178515 RepID=A0A172TP06_9BACL|nr:hypothetical protein SY83_09140 [Paenibacillus swuensis]